MSVFEVVITGLIYVFAVLLLIVLLLVVFTMLSRSKPGKRRAPGNGFGEGVDGAKESQEATGGADNAAGTAAITTGIDGSGSMETGEGTVPPEIVAAITAALTAFEEDNGRRKFKILSFRRVGR